jgi:hypothetical protein
MVVALEVLALGRSVPAGKRVSEVERRVRCDRDRQHEPVDRALVPGKLVERRTNH